MSKENAAKIIVQALLLIAILTGLAPSQTNTWVKATGAIPGGWSFPALVYAPNTDEFILSMGAHGGLYTVANYSHRLGKWINALPNDTLYGSASVSDSIEAINGKWADSTGYAYGFGRGQGNGVFGWGFQFAKVKGYLRPNPNPDDPATTAYSQFCYNTDDDKIYYYINNLTFTYNPSTRLWDTLNVSVHPGAGGVSVLRWGSLCYDAYNKEIVLFGGGALDKPYGSPGTWTFKPSTRTWTNLNPTVQPSPRAHSPMAYDPVNRCIVLFGGDRLNCLLNDTWVYDCASRTWSKKNPAIRPRPRGGHSLLRMPKSGKIVLMGGYRYDNVREWGNGTTDFEIWTYDVATNNWGLVKHFGSSELWPQLRVLGPALCGFVAVDKGDTILAISDSIPGQYHFTSTTMRLACDPTITDPTGTASYGATRDSVLIPGGSQNPSWYVDGVASPDTGANEANLRNLTQGIWTRITPPKTPGGDRTWGTAVLAPDRDLFMRWGGGHAANCGTDVPQYSIHDNRWQIGYVPELPMEYNGVNFPAVGPFTFNDRPFMPCHPVKSTAYDPISRLMVHFQSKYTYLYNPDSMDWIKGVRILNPIDNINYNPGSMTSYYVGLCSTPHGVYGNWYGGAGSHVFSADSLKWRKLPQIGTLPGYFADNSGAVYDTNRDRILFVSRSASSQAVLYEYRFADGRASQLFPEDSAGTTGTVNYRDGVYLPNMDVVLYPIRKTDANLAYDCANNRWILVPVQGFAAGMDDVGTAMMYDAKRNLVWLTNAGSAIYALRLDSAMTRAEQNRLSRETVSLTVTPNPFNPAATIILPAKKTGIKQPVSLRIFSADGRCVADLSRQAGHGDKVIWRAEALPSGLYVVKYGIGKRVWQVKAVLVR